MNEEYGNSINNEECENCTYYKNESCIRKAGVQTDKICVHYVNRWNAKSASKALDELIDTMVKSLIK